MLFERVAVPMARAGTRGAWLRGWRVMALDGVVLDVPDTPANLAEFGRSGNEETPSPFPQVRIVGLAQCGTHAVVDAARGPITIGEQTLTAELIPRLQPGMLVTADRNFYSYRAWQDALATGAALLWRVSASLTLPVLEWLPDGSYRSVLIDPKVKRRLSRTARRDPAALAAVGTPIRVVEYMIDNRAGGGELFCFITSILDHTAASAVELAAAYHERWEIELTFDEIEIHQTGGDRVLRSKSPQLVKQEIWGLLLTHYAIRHVVKDAADTVDIDPDRLSFIRSFRAIRRQIPGQAGFSP